MNSIRTDAHPFACHADGDIIARRGGQAWTMAEFRHDVTALAQRLPQRSQVMNLCADRYRFLVSFAAALVRKQVTIMPASTAPEALRAVSQEYMDLYAITDREELPIPSMVYPPHLNTAAPFLDLQLPAQQIASVQFTSGSTGAPKAIAKTWATLVHSARTAGLRLKVTSMAGASIVSTVPHQHSYGLESGILLALQHGFAVEARAPLYPADVRAVLAGTPHPRILVTTPVHLRALVAEADGMPPVDLVLSATAALPDSLALAAEACFAAPLMEIYGCTEAGQIAARRTAHETEWHLFDEVTVSQNDSGNWATGRAVEGVAPLQDLMEFTDPQHFRLGARAQDMVNVAGKRSSLPYLNSQLQSIPGVQDGVFVIDEEITTELVQRLMAVVVAPTLDPEILRHRLRERLDPVFIPRKLVLVETLPRNALGKVVRSDLLALLGRRS